MIYKNLMLHNCHEIVSDSNTGEEKMIRVPDYVRSAMSLIGRNYTAYNTPNTEIRFCMQSDKVVLQLGIFHPEGGNYKEQLFEVYFGCFQDDTIRIVSDRNPEIVIQRPENMELLKRIAKENNMPFDPEVVRVIAPGDCHLMIDNMEGNILLPKKEQLPEKCWLAYGSSITQGSNGQHPIGAYTAVASRILGVDLLNMGFGGSALLEPEMADFIAERRDFNFITLEMGINMTWNIEQNRLGNPKVFQERVDYFVSKVADAHPDKWIFCLDLFTNKDDYTKNTQSEIYRTIVKEKVKQINRQHVVWLDGKKYLTVQDGLCTDFIHPSSMGCTEIGTKLAKDISAYLSGEF